DADLVGDPAPDVELNPRRRYARVGERRPDFLSVAPEMDLEIGQSSRAAVSTVVDHDLADGLAGAEIGIPPGHEEGLRVRDRVVAEPPVRETVVRALSDAAIAGRVLNRGHAAREVSAVRRHHDRIELERVAVARIPLEVRDIHE